ncbi:DUF4357 domain-containing protein [Mucilaginibacter sp. 14171R-50]|uniref:DUF4357 domain-containing protein n=1 Tax=Mucilaginibacter sp. 14171R-50 TaxID=2703789 RepID=UPI00192ED4AA|nr:DUF4357 domain-containing protein [Mucilaginibacter sp. 14171R-50]
MPDAERRRLPEADRANMEAFLANLKVILPVVGLDLLKPRPIGVSRPTEAAKETVGQKEQIRFETRHKSGVKAYAVDEDGEFVVQINSEALKDTGYAKNSYKYLKEQLIEDGVLKPTPDGKRYYFSQTYAFKSPSAAGSVILDRNTNGRTRWYVVGTKMNYHEWQSGQMVDELSEDDE